MVTRSVKDYRETIRGLYPAGEWWDKQFADSRSDLSLYIDALSHEAHRTQMRTAALLEEAYPDRTVELVSLYERMFRTESSGNLVHRRDRVIATWVTRTFRPVDWNQIAERFGFRIAPQRQQGFCCGRSRTGERLWGVAARNYLVFFVFHPPGTQAADKGEFEGLMRLFSPPTYYLEFQYKENL